MTPQEKELLEKTARLAEENNDILKSIRRTQRIGNAMRALYWIAIIVLSIGGYYFAQTYIQSITGALNGVEGDVNLIDQYRDLLK